MTASLRRNTHADFVGIAELKRQQAEQLATFERAAAQGDWRAIHGDHYDWWMFPIDEASQYGTAYVVYEGDIAELKQDPHYVENYLRGVELLMQAWGWDVARSAPVEHPQPGQAWSRWPIRLYKAALSLRQFGYTDAFDSLKTYALDLMNRGESLHYGRDNLELLFTEGRTRR